MAKHLDQLISAGRRRRLPAVGLAAIAACGLLLGCSDGKDAASTESSAASSPAVSAATGSPSTVIASAVTQAGEVTQTGEAAAPPQTTITGVKSAIIPTPSEVLAGASTTVAPKDDGTLSVTPKDFSISARALNPAITIYKDRVGADKITTLDNPQPSGAPLTFLVDAQTNLRAKVLLPIRPNGSVGWVNLTDIRQERVDYRVRVELSAHKLIVLNSGRLDFEFPIGVGKATTPTPDGRYYIKELLKPPNPEGAYGPYAYGLSGFSDAVPNYNGGDGVLGIHGTNEPEKVGTDVSHGCIRLRNADISRLAEILPLGTPVEVIA